MPRPAAEEHNFTHKAFAKLGCAIGTALLREERLAIDPRPVWLSKTKVSAGVQGFDNEQELVDILERNGFDVIHPQNLTVKEQVHIFRSRKKIFGGVGSAFHNKIFGTNARVICLSPYEHINSNFALVDEVDDNRITFLRPELEQSSSSYPGRFTSGYSIKDPAEVGAALLALAL